MKTMKIADHTVPAIGLGTWHMGEPSNRQTEIKAIRAGIDAGATVIDTAEMYGNGLSEDLVGQAIDGLDREKLFLIDKVLPQNASKKRMEKSLDTSLKRLKTDYVDLYLYHWRGSVPLSETVATLQELQQSGKIKRWGVSNFDVVDMVELLGLPNGNNVAANEDLYNLGSRGLDFDMIPWLVKRDIPLIAYSPIAQGDRFGANLTTNKVIKAIADNHNATPYQILLAWVIRNGSTLAIPQSANPEHVVANVEAANITLSKEELFMIDSEYPAPESKQPLDIL
ncbi:aldo/keto reductase [Lentilactobacillus sp. Marseille-Q4993]|uniref:aldo/keto reductase n=1 Tax=Lentilactobacillus sp. Marseille-Q4993 TaxID=3039492 RepID=UPI0024BC1693|nr:aldo/keto reductase [Lentilactobacillus sp. Marseille-Q4993]